MTILGLDNRDQAVDPDDPTRLASREVDRQSRRLVAVDRMIGDLMHDRSMARQIPLGTDPFGRD